ENDLKVWFNKKDRLPLIIRGARQVGKSTLVRIFAERNNLELIEINLEKMKLNSVMQDSFEMQALLDELQIRTKKKIAKSTLIFFDEIQESPNLLKFLRYFYEEKPELAVIAAGSLLEIALKKEDFSFPVGRVEFYHLGPMSFTEFLWATDNHFLAEQIEALNFSSSVNAEAKKQLVNYYYVGGMPKAVKTFVEHGSLVPVREVQEQILQTYIADFPKYNARINTERVEKVFYAAVTQLGKKIIFQKLDSDANSRDTRRVLELLFDARVILKCSHSESNSVPLMGEVDHTIFKIYFLDVGLVNAIMRLDYETLDQEMKNNFNTKGMIAEQFVAQHLAYLGNERRGPELFYWLRDRGSQKGEIDFIIQKENEIIPIEVKASASGHLKSLFYFSKEKRKNKAVKISMDDYSLQKSSHKIGNDIVEIELMSLPQYAVETIKR
ncbi:MAG: ATP-binding protein, partial [Bacteriovoracaceae bacterium]|nr:ATP-binding protein [Bacteriovoracaceae bacterium]